jgi:uncharacterized protein (DUF427 family)
MAQRRVAPGPGQESVWDYPRPPRLEPVAERVRLLLGDLTVADTTGALRVLETSHPPVYYLPPADIRMDLIEPAGGSSYCEWKGVARYHALRSGERRLDKVAWSYPEPTPAFRALAGYLAFYLDPLAGFVGDEEARPQPGRFYGGWVTSRVVGPFKGEPGTGGW